MAKPTQAIFPIQNGKLITVLDANGFQIDNLDTSNLGLGGGGGGNDTGTTTAILKGDGNHGFADAIADTDYASVASVMAKEDTTDHDADVATINATIATLTSDVALKAYSSDVTNALSGKADAAATTTALAGKEPTLPTTANDSYILARHNAGAGSAWFFVDPLTLGTTNQTFTDGVENSTTTLTSATANFVANDVGKAITGDDIPGGTTIASRTNSTTIVLSQAATATGSGKTFTIYNRIEVTGSTGTVTDVSLNNTATELFTTSITNPSTSVVIGFQPAVILPNRFWGNPTNASQPGTTMTAAQARVSLGGTTVGQAFFQLTNPTAVGYPRINADNSITFRSTAQTLGDLGAETILTFSSPLVRGGVGNTTISIPPATDSVSGYLTAADHANFVAKVPSTRQISTTAPLTGGGDLSANRTLAMSAASSSQDGYLTQQAYSLFAAGAGANGTTLVAGNTSSVVIPIQTPPVIRVVFTDALTQSMSIFLPPAANYGASLNYPFIEFVDLVQGGAFASFGATIVPISSNLIDGSGTYVMPKGMGYLRLNSNGLATSQGRWTTSKYFVQSFQDPDDKTKRVTVDASGLPTNTTRVWRPAASGDSGSTINKPEITGEWLSSYDVSSGLFQSKPVHVFDLVSVQDDITAGAISSNAHTVPSSGTVDSVRLSASLTAPLTITWPQASLYGAGEVVRFYDATGSVNSTNNVTVVALAGDTINGAASVTVSEQYANRAFVADPTTNSWTASQFSGANQGNTVAFSNQLAESGANLIWPIVQGVNVQTAIALPTATRTLTFSGAPLIPGMKFDLLFKQPASGGPVTLNLPFGSMTPNNGLGVLDLSTTASAVDKITGTYYGVGGLVWAWETVKNYTKAAVVTCNTLGDVYPETAPGSGVWPATTATQNLAAASNAQYVATFLSTLIPSGAGTASVCKIEIPVYRVLNPTGDLTCYIYTNNAGVPGTVVAASGLVANAVVSATDAALARATPVAFSFTPAAALSVGTPYWVVLKSSTVTNSSNYFKWVALTGQTSTFATKRAADGPDANALTWGNIGVNQKMLLKTYHS